MSSEKHVEAHKRGGRPREHTGDGEPHQEVSGKTLNSSGGEYNPRATAVSRERVEYPGDNANVSTNVFEEGYGVQSGLVVGL
ncbi:hypothetical protein HPP92_000826 [Vanilla planifolia]|uniref:Uncharacterized protein n=1 Tax=Vanilla planifolia TaxID=51239 RepID=A0A835VGG8_VANPL|nr:hypothetical protein HPP92_000826 [Vanilla planifolia]